MKSSYAAGRVEGEEAPRPHSIGAGEEGGECPQDGDEAAEKNDRAAALQKQILAKLQSALIEMNEMAIASEQPEAEGAANPEADIVADDRACRSRRDDAENIETVVAKAMRMAGENSGGQQSCLAGKGIPALSIMTTQKIAA